jgi:hypothetical protein
MVGINGFMFKPFSKLSDRESIIDCCCFIDNDISNMFKVTEIICKREGERAGFSVGMLEKMPSNINYNGLKTSIIDSSMKNEQPSINFEYYDDLPPSISINS